jgi:hypothetical protein
MVLHKSTKPTEGSRKPNFRRLREMSDLQRNNMKFQIKTSSNNIYSHNATFRRVKYPKKLNRILKTSVRFESTSVGTQNRARLYRNLSKACAKEPTLGTDKILTRTSCDYCHCPTTPKI